MHVIGVILIFLPFAAAWFIIMRLTRYRRDGRGVLATIFQWQFHALRPDLYTDEGQDLVRWLWTVAILTIPWFVLTAFLFLR
jgi:hypothetical protein